MVGAVVHSPGGGFSRDCGLCPLGPPLAAADRPPPRPQVPAGLLLPRAVGLLHHQGVREELGGSALHLGESLAGRAAAEAVVGGLSPSPLLQRL